MSTLLDDRWALAKESTYGTGVTVTRFYPMLDETDSDWDPRPRQGMGLQGGNGRRAMLGSRRFLPIGQGKITTKVELESKGAGVLFDAICGSSTVTAITGGAQMLFHDGIATTTLSSYTLQIVKVQNNGTEWVETYSGCTVSKWTIEQPEDAIPTLTVEWDARSVTTATAAASVTYASAPVIFDHSQGAAGLGGTLTAPTTTVLATGLTAYADVVSYKLEVDQAIDASRWVLGSRSQPTVGIPKIAFTGSFEFNATTVPAGLIAGTKFPLYVTYTTTETLGAGTTQLQVVLPQVALTGKLPQTKRDTTREIEVSADVLSDGTNKDFWLVYRTTDTAL